MRMSANTTSLQNMNRLRENNPDIEKTYRLINTLPDDILRKIYEEYFECNDVCKEFLERLK